MWKVFNSNGILGWHGVSLLHTKPKNMEDNNFSQESSAAGKKDYRTLIYSGLAAALLITWGYIIYDKNKVKEQVNALTNQNTLVTNERDQVREEYNKSLIRLDSLMGENQMMSDSLDTRNSEIAKLRAEIRRVINNKNATAADLARARQMINELNSRIENLAMEVKRLEGENQELIATNERIVTEKKAVEAQLANTETEKQTIQKNLEETADIASTLRATNINIFALNERNSGKEKQTSIAKKADKLRITFELDENRLAKDGEKELYITVTAPDGSPISNSTVFTAREEGEKPYTSRLTIPYERTKKNPVSFDWRSDKGFQTGNYKIEIYHNGFKIGEGVRSLKKGGLFG
jgi:myosin heavy subunit